MTARSAKPHPRKRPRQRRSLATVEAILVAAAETFVSAGFEHATVHAIADRAGVSIGSLYQYFPNREALLVALIEKHTDASLLELEHALASAEAMPLDEAVRLVVSSMVRAHQSPLHRLLARELDELGRLDAVQRAIDRRAGRAVAQFLTRRSSDIRAPHVEVASFLLVRAVDVLTHALVNDCPSPLGELEQIDELCALVTGYLREPRTRPAGPPDCPALHS